MGVVQGGSTQSVVVQDTEFNKRYAQRVLTRIDHLQGFAAEQVASTAKWLTASLLAVNGAGALAAVNALKDGGAWLPSLLFTLGIISALLSATAMQEIYNNTSDPLLSHDNYWIQVADNGYRDPNEEDSLQAASTAAMRLARMPPILGWISGLLFLAGAVLLALNVTSGESANARRCLSIERDMLSARPKRANSAELYTALGCGPSA